MSPQPRLITIKYRGVRYRGAYYLRGAHLVVEAREAGRTTADAALVDFKLDASAAKLAKILLMELVKETVAADDSGLLTLAAQGSTTRATVCGSTTQLTL